MRRFRISELNVILFITWTGVSQASFFVAGAAVSETSSEISVALFPSGLYLQSFWENQLLPSTVIDLCRVGLIQLDWILFCFVFVSYIGFCSNSHTGKFLLTFNHKIIKNRADITQLTSNLVERERERERINSVWVGLCFVRCLDMLRPKIDFF